MSQQVKPYIDNWLRTRQGVSDLIDAFSDKGIKTKLAESMATPGAFDHLMRRAELFLNLRNNRGAMILDKDEEFFNVTTPLGTLDKLQAQSIEQVAIIPGIPLVKLLGVTPSGLNASSDGETRIFYDGINAYQDTTFSPNLDRVFRFAQINLWGEVDPDLTYVYEPLWSMSEKEAAEIDRSKAETDKALVEARILSRSEARGRLAHATDSMYPGLDPDKVPPPSVTEATGLAIQKASLYLQAGEGGDVPPDQILAGLRETGLFPGITNALIEAAKARSAEAPPPVDADA